MHRRRQTRAQHHAGCVGISGATHLRKRQQELPEGPSFDSGEDHPALPACGPAPGSYASRTSRMRPSAKTLRFPHFPYAARRLDHTLPALPACGLLPTSHLPRNFSMRPGAWTIRFPHFPHATRRLDHTLPALPACGLLPTSHLPRNFSTRDDHGRRCLHLFRGDIPQLLTSSPAPA